MSKYKLVNMHARKRCHPKTCCCSNEYGITKDGEVIDWADDDTEGNAKIAKLMYEDTIENNNTMSTRKLLTNSFEKLSKEQRTEFERRIKYNTRINKEMDSLLQYFHKISNARLRKWMKQNHINAVGVYLANSMNKNFSYFMSTYNVVIVIDRHLSIIVNDNVRYTNSGMTIMKVNKKQTYRHIDRRGMLGYLYVDSDLFKLITTWESNNVT